MTRHTPSPLSSRRGHRGLTLIELMIALGVVAILATVVVPSYRDRVTASRRTDATATLLTLAQLMERAYSEQGTYANARVGASGIHPSQSPQGHYTVSIVSQSAEAYAIKATPAGGQAGDRCGSYTYDQAGTKGVTGTGVTVTDCW